MEGKEEKAFGKLKGTVHVKGDITSPIKEAWNAAKSIFEVMQEVL